MSHDFGQTQIKFGFILVSLTFSIPIFILFYFMINFKNINIFFTRDQLAGARKIDQLLPSLEIVPTIQLVQQTQTLENESKLILDPDLDSYYIQQMRILGEESKLILDPDLDSYYIMYTTIITLPRIYSYFNKYKSTKLSVQKKETLKILLRNNIEQMSLGIKTALSEDIFFHGTNKDLQAKEYVDAYQRIIKLTTDSLEANSNVATLADIKNFWQATNKVLIGLLNQRESQLVKERSQAIGVTTGLWIFSLILVFYFATKVLNKQKNLYEEIEIKNVKLSIAAKMSSLGEMAGGVAHEINTPLAIIQVRTEQMQMCLSEDILDKALLSEALQIIEKTVIRVAQIVSGLKNFSRDGSSAPMEKYSVTNIVNDTFSLCKERFRNNNVKLDYISDQDYQINCRSVELSQVLLNLLNNSFDAIQPLTEKWIKVEAAQSKDFVILSVTDSGLGIPKELQNKIMEPFFTTKEIGKGTGLGLSISAGLIKSQNGQMYLDTESKNTKFIIKLKYAS